MHCVPAMQANFLSPLLTSRNFSPNICSKQPEMYVEMGLEESNELSVATSILPISFGSISSLSISLYAAFAPIVTISS